MRLYHGCRRHGYQSGKLWKFPYLAYGGGGGAFVRNLHRYVYCAGPPVVEMESAIGRYARTNGIDAYGVVNKKWKFAGAINVVCTVLIDMYYIIVSGYVSKICNCLSSRRQISAQIKKLIIWTSFLTRWNL
ncbi:MAG: hypothetical protein V8S08_06590 [Lachnoclostridium sp.]